MGGKTMGRIKEFLKTVSWNDGLVLTMIILEFILFCLLICSCSTQKIASCSELYDTIVIIQKDTLVSIKHRIDTVKESHDTLIIKDKDGSELYRSITNNYYNSNKERDTIYINHQYNEQQISDAHEIIEEQDDDNNKLRIVFFIAIAIAFCYLFYKKG